MTFGSTTPSRIGGLVFMSAGLVLLALAVRSTLDVSAFARTATRVIGTVTTLNAGGSHPQISFVASDGKIVSYPQGGLIFGYRPGDSVQVLFNPGDPRGSATIDAVGALWFTPLLFGTLGAVFLIAGTATLLTAGTRG